MDAHQFAQIQPMLTLRDAKARASSNRETRKSLRARITVALNLAIRNSPTEAFQVLADVRPETDRSDNGIVALYFQAYALANIKARLLDEGFKAFEFALEAARSHGESALCGKILNNYGTAAVHTGRIDVAVARLEEALEGHRRLGCSQAVGLVSLAEAVFAAGDLQRAAALLREFYAMDGEEPTSIHCDVSTLQMAASAVGIPVGIMLSDRMLLKLSHDPTLLQIGFSRREQWLLGPIVEAFCALYEHQGQRQEHDALLARATDSLSSFDNSLQLGIRAARLGAAHQLARIRTLLSRECAGTSSLLHAYEDLFESFIAARRQMARSAEDFGLRAAREFARTGRPFQQALALEAAGFPNEAQELRSKHGALVESMRLKWMGPPIPRRMVRELTPREYEIARLAVEGLTNRTIAAKLGLSERTVQHHCESIFGKLGIHSRWQLCRTTLRSPEQTAAARS